MKYLSTKRFLKDLESHRDAKLKLRLQAIYDVLDRAADLAAVPNAEALTGYPLHYRIRLGDYRIGCRMEADTLVLARFLHRREIYRHFP